MAQQQQAQAAPRARRRSVGDALVAVEIREERPERAHLVWVQVRVRAAGCGFGFGFGLGFGLGFGFEFGFGLEG